MDVVEQAFRTLENRSRAELLVKRARRPLPADFIPFPFPMSSDADVSSTLKSLHHGLRADPLTSRIFPKPQRHIPTRGTTVQDVVMQAALPSERKAKGCFKCDDPTCPIHCILAEGDTIVSMSNNNFHRIGGHLTCDTPHVVYVVTCWKCGLQGVGETSNAIRRGQLYIAAASGIDQSATYEIARHFQDHEHTAADMLLQLVDAVPPRFAAADVVAAERQRLENVWIRRLEANLNVRRQWWRSLTATGRRQEEAIETHTASAHNRHRIISAAVVL